MIGEEDLYDTPGVSVMKEEVLSEDDTDVGDTSASVENDDKCNERETVWIPIKKHEPSWSDWGVQDIEFTEKKLFGDRREVQRDLPITEEAPNYLDIVKHEFVDPEFVCVDPNEPKALDQTTDKCVDPLADADVKKHYYTTSKYEFQECLSDQHGIDTFSTDSRSRNIVNSSLADDSNEKNPWSSSTASINISREHPPDTVADHLPDLHTPHQCETCGITFMTSRLLSTHVKSHWNKCDKCGRRFKSKTRLLSHIQQNCSHVLSIKCDCGKSFKYRADLLAHKKHDCNRQEPHMCTSCGKTYKIIASLWKHKKHDCGRQEPRNCESCGKPYKNLASLRYHKKHDCGRQEPHKCESCGKLYNNIVSLWKHKKHDCGRQEPHKCESCGRFYKSIASLRNHKKHNCGRQEGHNCESCGKSYKNIASLRSHKKHNCGRQEPLNCESCGKSYKYIASLRNHKHGCGH